MQCELGHENLMLLLSQRFRSADDVTQYIFRGSRLAALACPIQALSQLVCALPACSRLRVRGWVHPRTPRGV